MNLPAGTRRYPPLWIYWRRNSAVLTAAQSWCTAACLLLPSPPTWSCDCRDNSWHHSYKIRALGCRGLFILWFSYLFLNSFDSQLYSCPCFAVSLFLCLPVSFSLCIWREFQFLLSSEWFSAFSSASPFLSLSYPCFPGQCDASQSPAQVTFSALSLSAWWHPQLFEAGVLTGCWTALSFIFNQRAETQAAA